MKTMKKLKNFFLRCCLYSVVILWPFTKLQNIYQTVEHFKSMVFKNLDFYGFKFDPQSKSNDDTILIIFFFYTLAEFVICCLGIFNFYFAHILSILFFIITSFIYFNPFMPENEIKLIATKEELFYNIGVLASLCVLAFRPKEKQEEEKIVIETKNIEDEEMKKSMPVKKSKRI